MAQRLEVPPVADWDPTVVRWVENAAVFGGDPPSVLAAVVVDDTPWSRTIAAALSPAARAAIVDHIHGLVGGAKDKVEQKVAAPPDDEGPLFTPLFQERFETWRAERVTTIGDLSDVVREADLTELFAQSFEMGGGRVTPWPLSCLVVPRYASAIEPGDVWSTPVVVCTEHSRIRVQRSVDYEQAKAIANGRTLIVVPIENEGAIVETYRMPIRSDLEPIELSGGQYLSDEVSGITLARPSDKHDAFTPFMRDLLGQHGGNALIWMCFEHAEYGSPLDRPEDDVQPVDGIVSFLTEIRNDVLITTAPASIEQPPGDYLPLLFDRLTRIDGIPLARPALADRAVGTDLLDQERVARAMALVACLQKSTLPLCFGVFGEWGSGKSFLMELICKEIQGGLESAPTSMADKLYRKVAIVRFNAWTYAKSDLWSALLYQLLRELQTWRYQNPKTLTKELKDKAVEVEEYEAELSEIDRSIDLVRRQIQSRADASPGELIRAAAENRLAELDATVKTCREEWKTWPKQLADWLGQSFTGKKQLHRAGALWVAALTGVVLLVKWVFPDLLSELSGWIPATIGLISGGAVTGEGIKKTALELRKSFTTARDAFQNTQKEVEAAVARLRDEANAKLLGDAKQLETDRKAKATQLEAARKALATVQRVAAPKLPAETLDEFLSQRLTEGDYASRLGPMQRVERDLHDLSLYFSRAAEDNSVPERVILCIDDLDRCPPDKVVDILEAIQLLLADNSDLERGKYGHPFVIVLGADTRILTRALEKEYSEILTRSDRPSGLDYIEKIIQIPYWIPPIDRSGFERYVVELTGVDFPLDAPRPRARRAGGTPTPTGQSRTAGFQPVELQIEPGDLVTETDMGWFRTFQVVAPASPRAIKRLVNQFRLCKAIALQSGVSFSTRETVFLLFLADGFRASTRVIARALELAVDDGTRLTTFFERITTAQDLGALRNEIKLLIERLKAIDDDVPTLGDLARVSRDVLPYCFIGDVSQRAGQDVSQVQLDSAAETWTGTGAGFETHASQPRTMRGLESEGADDEEPA